MSVTELLISDATVTSLPIDQVTPAPDNPRVDLGDLTELAATIADVGILQRIVVTKRAGRHIIVAGHRRHAAAVQAGLDEVPVEIVDIDEPTRQAMMMVENLHRRDLDPVEEATGYAALVALGMSQRDIAAKVGRTQPHVSKRLKLLDLPDDVHAAIRSGAWTIEDALHLAKLAKAPSLLRTVFKAASDPHFYGTVARMVDETLQHIAGEKKKREVLAQLERDQVTIFDAPGKHTHIRDGGYLMLPPGHRPIGDWAGALKIADPAKHDGEPCHATAVLSDGRTLPICTDTSRHTLTTSVAPPARTPTLDDAADRDRRDRERATRRDAARQAVAPPSKVTAELAWELLTIALRDRLDVQAMPTLRLACDWLGIDVERPPGMILEPVDLADAIFTHATASRPFLAAAWRAVWAAEPETIIGRVTPDRLTVVADEREAAYLDWLTGTGYAPTDDEQDFVAQVAAR